MMRLFTLSGAEFFSARKMYSRKIFNKSEAKYFPRMDVFLHLIICVTSIIVTFNQISIEIRLYKIAALATPNAAGIQLKYNFKIITDTIRV